MKRLIIIMMGILLMASMINLVDAEIQFFQQKLVNRNPSASGNPNESLTNTTTIHAFLDFKKETNDFIKGDAPLEFYIQFDITIDTWNAVNPDFSVDTCNFTTRTFSGIQNATLDFNQVFTGDNINDKHFVRLKSGELWVADIDCHFNGKNTSLQIPANMQIVTPTFECKACQFFKWTQVEADIIKAESIGNNVVDVTNIIKEFIRLNFEILLTLFWIVLIVIAVHSTGLLFLGMIWMLGYLKSFTK